MTPVEVTHANFEQVVIEGSATRAVLVDFWAPWCGPCRSLAPVLERVAGEFADRLTLAKLNTDAEPELAARFGIRGIPNCKLFVDGRVADEFTGALPAGAVREFLSHALPSRVAPLVAAARERLAAGDAHGALAKLEEAQHLDPEDEALLFARIEALLAAGRGPDAAATIARIERSERELRDARGFAALKARVALTGERHEDLGDLARAAAAEPVDCAAKLAYARALAATHAFEGALAELLAIVRTDRRFGDDVGRRTMLTIFEALPPDSDTVRRYRRELASVLH